MAKKRKAIEKAARYIFLIILVVTCLLLLDEEKIIFSSQEGWYAFIAIAGIAGIAGISYFYYLFKRKREGEKLKKILRQVGIDILIVLFWAIFLGGIRGGSDTLSAISSITILILLVCVSGLLIVYFAVKRKSESKGESIKKILQKVARHIIPVLLVVLSSYAVFIIIINPESYFFGTKLSGVSAVNLLLIEGVSAIVILILLFKKKAVGEILSLMFFEYRFLEAMISDLRIFQYRYEIPLSNIGLIGLVLSFALLLIRTTE